MKESEFDITKDCGKCKKPLSEHDSILYGSECPNDEIEFDGVFDFEKMVDNVMYEVNLPGFDCKIMKTPEGKIVLKDLEE